MSNNLQFSFAPTNIDFEESKARLRSALERSGTWSGVIDNQVGTALIDYMATINTFAQQRVLSCFREAFPETAASDRASFSLAAMQGIRLTRNSPATCPVVLSSPEAISIPPYTKFVAGGNVAMFNRLQIFLRPNEPQTVTLAEGKVSFLVAEGIGTDFQSVVPLERDFVVSNEDIAVELDGETVQRITDGLWNYRGQGAFQDATLPDGRALIRFGTSVFGTRPGAGSVVRIAYALTKGADGNSLGAAGETVNCPNFTTVRGTMTAALSGGSDRRNPLSYKNVDSPNFGSFGAAVKKTQYVSTALEFPGVIDVRMFAQREIDPTDVRWMNLFKVVPLVQQGWTYADQLKLIEHMQARTMYAGRFCVEYPVARPVDVTIRAYCSKWANPTSVKNAIIDAVTALFDLGRGSLQKDLFLSTLSDTVQGASSDVRHFDVVRPFSNVVVSSESIQPPTVAIVEGVGSLTPGPHIYGVAALISQNEDGLEGYLKMVDTTQALVTSTGSSAVITWTPLPNALEYHVYGRGTGPGQFGLLETIVVTPGVAWNSANMSWTDEGTALPSASAPTRSDFQIQYVTLNTLDVTVEVART
jgi:hypothetical protein